MIPARYLFDVGAKFVNVDGFVVNPIKVEPPNVV